MVVGAAGVVEDERRLSLAHQGAKPGLLKMMVIGKCVSNAALLHDDERNAVYHSPLFVGPGRIKLTPFLKKLTL